LVAIREKGVKIGLSRENHGAPSSRPAMAGSIRR
jgi:hypothetical protein